MEWWHRHMYWWRWNAWTRTVRLVNFATKYNEVLKAICIFSLYHHLPGILWIPIKKQSKLIGRKAYFWNPLLRPLDSKEYLAMTRILTHSYPVPWEHSLTFRLKELRDVYNVRQVWKTFPYTIGFQTVCLEAETAEIRLPQAKFITPW